MSTKLEALARDCRVLDRLFQGQSLSAARRAEGYSHSGRGMSYMAFFRNAELRRIALDRIVNEGERLGIDALHGLVQAEQQVKPASNADIVAALGRIETQLGAVNDRADKIEQRLAPLSDEALIDRARDAAQHDNVGFLHWALRDLRQNYNPLTLNSLRRLMRSPLRSRP